MKNTYKFLFVSKVAGRIVLRINFFMILPYQHFNFRKTLFQLCRLLFKQRWSDVENETKFEIEFAALHNIETMSMPSVETILNQRCIASMQPFFKVAQCRFNFVSTLISHHLNVVSTWLQHQLKLNQNQSGYWKVWICRNLISFILIYSNIFLQYINYLTINKSLK